LSTATFVRRCADVSPLSTMMAKARWATMIATGDDDDGDGATGNDDDGDGVTGDGATGYDDDNDGNWRRQQRRWRRRDGRRRDRQRRR
jgi:hypothetical protein